MPEQMGRSSKKPKYQIADIGGADLTPQDISTERVLNFLIRGESTPSTDQPPTASVPASGDLDAVSSADTALTRLNESRPSSPLPPSESGGRKSLAHLYERASRGDAGTGKDPKVDLGMREQSSPPDPDVEVKRVAETRPEPPSRINDVTAEPFLPPSEATATARATMVGEPRSRLISPDKTQENTAITPPIGKLLPADTRASSNNAQLVSLWRTYYRLNDGEIQTLGVLHRIAREQGFTECYVKMHQLAELSSLTYRYCQKVVRSLENLGWITKLRDYDPSDQRGVLYRVNSKPTTADGL